MQRAETLKARRGRAFGTFRRRWRVIPVDGLGARLWLPPSSLSDRDSSRLIDLFQNEIHRILDTLELSDRSSATVDVYLHAEDGEAVVCKDVPLGPGCGFAGIMPIWHRPFVQMTYSEEWNIDLHSPALPSFRALAANEIVKAYLLLIVPPMAVPWSRRIGWVEEGVAAYLQGPTFDNHDLDVWASAIAELGAARSIAKLIDTDFCVEDWSEADRLVFDRILIRELGSFWRFWNSLQGIRPFLAYHKGRFKLLERWTVRLKNRPWNPFEAAYGTRLSDAEEHWRKELGSRRRELPQEVTDLIKPAAAVVKESRWNGIPHG